MSLLLRALLIGAPLSLAPALAAAQRPEVRPLGSFVGTWRVRGEAHDTRYSGAGTSTGTLTCGWSSGGRFLVCDVTVLAGGDSTEQISVYAPAADGGGFLSYGVTTGGRPAFESRVTIAGAVWTYEGVSPPAHGPRWRTVNEFTAPGEVRWHVQFSDDGEHWTTTMEGVDTRVP